jgi:5-methylcytosine-specific restriction endonuclease McrA/peptidoglycan hydrolase-like protein with peptidoglycan-binding domain
VILRLALVCFLLCFGGFSELIAETLIIKQEGLDQKFRSCKYGFPDCNPSLLTAEQSETAKQEALDWNFTSCKQDWNDCNRSLLAKSQTEPQAEIKEVSETAKRDSKSTVFNAQFKLKQLGYMVGRKGQWDDVSQTAAKQFARDYGLEVDASYERILPYLQQAEAGKLKRTITKPEPRAVVPEVEVVESKPEPVIEAKVKVVKPESIATVNSTPNIFDQFDEERKPTEVVESKVEVIEPEPVIEPKVEVIDPDPDRLVLEAQRHLQALGYRVDYNGVMDTNSVEASNQFIQDYGISVSSFLSAEDFVVYLRMAREGTLRRVDIRPESIMEVKPEPKLVADAKPKLEATPPESVVETKIASEPVKLYWDRSQGNVLDVFASGVVKGIIFLLAFLVLRWVYRLFTKQGYSGDSPLASDSKEQERKPEQTQLIAESDKGANPSNPVRPEPVVPPEPIGLPVSNYQVVVERMTNAIEDSQSILEYANHYNRLPLKPRAGTWSKTVERWAKQYNGDIHLMSEAFLRHYEDSLANTFLNKSCGLNPTSTPDYLLQHVHYSTFWEQESRYRHYDDYPPDWEVRRTLVLMREQAHCQRCGVLCDLNKAHVHHIIPKAQGGDHGLDNLAFLCRDCHSCMPSGGHLDIRGYTRYLVSNTRKLHTPECKYGGKSIWGKASSWQWQNDYTYCRLCDPLAYHHKQVQAWKPDIVRVFSLYREEIKQDLIKSFF